MGNGVSTVPHRASTPARRGVPGCGGDVMVRCAEENPDDTCPICLEGVKNGVPSGNCGCRARYHQQCIKTWREHRRTCPTCRVALNGAYVEWWGNGNKRYERKGDHETYWWSNGRRKCRLVLNGEAAVRGEYTTSTGSHTVAITQLGRCEVAKIRADWGYIFIDY